MAMAHGTMRARMLRLAGLALCVLMLAAAANAGTWLSQKHDRASLREGPGFSHRILWVYRHKGYPFQLIASYGNWRRVRDADGIAGWMHVTMLTTRRTVLVTGKTRAPIRAGARADAPVIDYAEPGAIARLKACAAHACRIDQDGIDGWIAKARLWGVGADEVFK
jgi:SH3-like domain-containing protein